MRNLDFEPYGPPDPEKLEESASHHWETLAFARQRAEKLPSKAGRPGRVSKIIKC